MDSLIAAAARGLAAGDPLGALNYIALRDDAPALALRGIAMAQLGDLTRAKSLLSRAALAFGPKESVARARCVVAEAEIALVSRNLNWPVKALDAARATLEANGDAVNAAHARHLAIRRFILIGRLGEAEQLLEGFDPSPLPPALRAGHELVIAGIALRHLKTAPARRALARAKQAARAAGISPLLAEVEAMALALTNARGATHQARAREGAAARGGRSPARVEDARRRRLSRRRAVRRNGGLSRKSAGAVFACPRPGRSLAWGCLARKAAGARVSRQARR